MYYTSFMDNDLIAECSMICSTPPSSSRVVPSARAPKNELKAWVSSTARRPNSCTARALRLRRPLRWKAEHKQGYGALGRGIPHLWGKKQKRGGRHRRANLPWVGEKIVTDTQPTPPSSVRIKCQGQVCRGVGPCFQGLGHTVTATRTRRVVGECGACSSVLG